MEQADDKIKNIIAENTELIHRTIMVLADPQFSPDLDALLQTAEDNGWTSLVQAIRKILGGERELSQLAGLDEEDRIIVTAILQGIEDRSSLPDLANAIDPSAAAPSMAKLLYEACAGNDYAIQAISAVERQMSGTSGDFSRIPDALNLMVGGERRQDVLSNGMGAAGTALIEAILEELKKLEVL